MSSSERWTVGVSVVSTLIATCGTLFAGYQALLTRDALFSSRTTNLQIKQVDYCERFLVALSGFNQAFEAQQTRFDKETIFGAVGLTGTAGEVEDSESSPWGPEGVNELMVSVFDSDLMRSANKIRASADFLSIYASALSVDMLDSVASNAFTLAFISSVRGDFTSVKFPQGTPDEINARITESASVLAEKCKVVTLGQSQGLF